MKLADLLTDHMASISPDHPGIQAVLGDPFLCRHNSIFRNVRDAALALGYKFTDKDSKLWRSYQAFSLATLNWLIEAKEIPFVDNTSVLEHVSRRNPSLDMPTPLLLTILKRNYLMHEGAHCIAASVMEFVPDPYLNGLSEKSNFVMRSLLSEAFANTVERLSSSRASAGLHGLYFVLNSYIPYSHAEVDEIAALAANFGERTLFIFGFSLYFFSNVFTNTLTAAQLTTLVQTAYGDLFADVKMGLMLANALIKNRFSVNPRFRQETNVMFFEQFLCSDAFNSLVDSPALLLPDALQAIRRYSEVFWNIVEKGIAGLESAISEAVTLQH